MVKEYLYLSDLLEQELFMDFYNDFCSSCSECMSCSLSMRDKECARHASYLKVVEAVKEFNAKLTDAVSE